jgi:hypothetical protein
MRYVLLRGAMAEAEQKNMDMPEEEHKKRNLEWLERTGQIFASDNFMEHEDQHWDLTYIPGFNAVMVRHIMQNAGVRTKEQLYEKYREMGQNYVGMRDWLERHTDDSSRVLERSALLRQF